MHQWHYFISIINTFTGFDPAGVKLAFLGKIKFIQKGDAKYVQLVHTSGLYGTLSHTGDCSVKVGNGLVQKGCDSLSACSHIRAYLINDLITSQRYAFIASNNTGTQMYNLKQNPNIQVENIRVEKNQCMVGIYNADHTPGEFRIDIEPELFK